MGETFSALAGGFAAALTPVNLIWAFVGCFTGTAIGVLPGIGPALTVAMLLPLTAKVDPASALILFAGIRERLEAADVPVHFRGTAIAMITAGLMSLAFMGFAGLDKYK